MMQRVSDLKLIDHPHRGLPDGSGVHFDSILSKTLSRFRNPESAKKIYMN